MTLSMSQEHLIIQRCWHKTDHETFSPLQLLTQAWSATREILSRIAGIQEREGTFSGILLRNYKGKLGFPVLTGLFLDLHHPLYSPVYLRNFFPAPAPFLVKDNRPGECAIAHWGSWPQVSCFHLSQVRHLPIFGTSFPIVWILFISTIRNFVTLWP